MNEREELVAAAKAVAARLGLTSLSKSVFRRETGIDTRKVYRLFESWPALCRAAGLAPGPCTARVEDETIFAAMHRAFAAAGGVCTLQHLLREAPFSARVVRRRFGTWPRMLEAFHPWAQRNAADAPYMAALEARLDAAPAAPAPASGAGGLPAWRALGGRVTGEPIDFRALAFAPINEQGVVLLFGMTAEALGYRVETVAAAFPDCTAKRHVGGGRWEAVRIEFEYRSRSFREHGHDPEGCDIVVCWEHDWPACPVEVLALSEAIAGLRPG
jgi:hypothetical protein